MSDKDGPKQDETYVVLSDCAVVFNHNQAIKDAVFEKLINWYFEHREFSGEGIMQCDDTLIDAPNILAHIAEDIIKFDVRWDE